VRSDSQTIDEHLQTDLQISMSLVELTLQLNVAHTHKFYEAQIPIFN